MFGQGKVNDKKENWDKIWMLCAMIVCLGQVVLRACLQL